MSCNITNNNKSNTFSCHLKQVKYNNFNLNVNKRRLEVKQSKMRGYEEVFYIYGVYAQFYIDGCK